MPNRGLPRWIELWDGRRELGRFEDGIATFDYGHVPSGLATPRQLRRAGLCPGGADPVAQIKWRRGKRFAALYRLDLAKPKRTPTPAQHQSIQAALAARRRCERCGTDSGYYLPRNNRLCLDCDPDTINELPEQFTTT